MESLLPELAKLGVLFLVLGVAIFLLLKHVAKLERERLKREHEMNDRMDKDAGRCHDDLSDAVKRIRALEESRLQDHRDDKRALMAVLTTSTEALRMNASSFGKLTDLESARESASGNHVVIRREGHGPDDLNPLERKG